MTETVIAANVPIVVDVGAGRICPKCTSGCGDRHLTCVGRHSSP